MGSWSSKRRWVRRQPSGKRRRRSETSRPVYLSATSLSLKAAPLPPLPEGERCRQIQKSTGFTVGRRRFNVRRLDLFKWSGKRRWMRRQPFGKRRHRSKMSRPFYLSATPLSRKDAPHLPPLPKGKSRSEIQKSTSFTVGRRRFNVRGPVALQLIAPGEANEGLSPGRRRRRPDTN